MVKQESQEVCMAVSHEISPQKKRQQQIEDRQYEGARKNSRKSQLLSSESLLCLAIPNYGKSSFYFQHDVK